MRKLELEYANRTNPKNTVVVKARFMFGDGDEYRTETMGAFHLVSHKFNQPNVKNLSLSQLKLFEFIDVLKAMQDMDPDELGDEPDWGLVEDKWPSDEYNLGYLDEIILQAFDVDGNEMKAKVVEYDPSEAD